MKTINKIFLGTLMAMGLTSCSLESPFTVEPAEGSGRLLKSNIALNVKGVSPITKGLTAGVPDPADFKVEIVKKGETSSFQSYSKYGDMPEVITLPEGEYKIKVSFGGSYGNDMSNAAFNCPYYRGESENFKVEIDKIVSNIAPIVCKLQNVRVAVNFDTSLTSAMSDDSRVAVQLGTGTTLYYNKETREDGFFEYNPGNLTATFIGTVEGLEVNETKSFDKDKVAAGNYYIITFKLHNADASNPGNIVPGGSEDNNGFSVDASVGYTDLNESQNGYDPGLNPDDPNNRYIEDDMRPENGQTPGSGSEDDETIKKPVVIGNNGLKINEENINPTSCSFTVKSQTGITGFEVDIDSVLLNADELSEVGLDSHLDLINPKNDELAESIQGLGFPIREDVFGQPEVTLSIAPDFLGLLEVLGNGTHNFLIKVTDAGGTTNAKLIITINK